MATVTTAERSGRGLRAVVWTVLAVGVFTHLAWDLALATDDDDTQHLETPLLLAAAGQYGDGPGALYGPFRGSNHRVLVHAPLYYRLTAAAALPLVALGWVPLTACLLTGRLVSFLAFLGVLAAVGRLAVLDGPDQPRRAACWAMALAASTHVLAAYPVTVRPDMLALFFQTAGMVGVLKALLTTPEGARPRGLSTAAVMLGLAFCTRQNAVAAALVSGALLARAAWRRPGWWSRLGPAGLVGLAVVAGYYGAEELLTAGQTSRTVFLLPIELSRLAPGTWMLGAVVLANVLGAGFTLVALGLASRKARGGRPDALLWLYVGAEAVLVVLLCRGNAGAWHNYAVPGVVIACAPVGRALARLTRPGAVPRGAWVVVPAALLALVIDLVLTYGNISRKVVEEGMVWGILADGRVGASRQVYFPGLPGYNRRFGRTDLAHDEWLYGLFERAGAAEPRSAWLRPALERQVRVVVVPRDPPISFPTEPPIVPGLREPLSALGYAPIIENGRFRAWERHTPAPPLAPGLGPP